MQQNHVLTKGPKMVLNFTSKFERTLKMDFGMLITLYYSLYCIITELQVGQSFLNSTEDQFASFFVALSCISRFSMNKFGGTVCVTKSSSTDV